MDPPKQRTVFHSIVRELDVLENSAMPVVSVSTQQIEFGDVRFGHAEIKTLTVSNTGKVRPHNYLSLFLSLSVSHMLHVHHLLFMRVDTR